jgi:hypothetical protein
MTIRDQRDATPADVRATFEEHSADLGFASCCSSATSTIRAGDATSRSPMAAEDTVPQVWPLFWAFRIMVALGFAFIAVMAYFFWRASFKGMQYPRWALCGRGRDHPDAVDRGGAGLVRRRIRPPALDGGRRAADRPVSQPPERATC